MDERSFALRLEYDGTGFGGSQFQANARTVQGELERALAPLVSAGTTVRRIALAGRTDAGVHATGQIAGLMVPARWTSVNLMRALNGRLPEDLAVTGCVEVPEAFDPRRWAVSRSYAYDVLDDPVRSPLLRRSAWHVRAAVDEDAVASAAGLLQGEHDFAAFAGPVEPGRSTVRRMSSASVRRRGRLLRFEFEANAFLPHQVRRMVGALVEVGRGKQAVSGFEAVLRSARPGVAGPAAPPHGLCLVGVTYRDVRFEGERS